MPTQYIAEMDEARQISAIWVKSKNQKSIRVFDPKRDFLDPNEASQFDGASEEEIKKWVAMQKAISAP